MRPHAVISFFFQAEDGIRDGHVTGVQTCALPISEYLCAGLVAGNAIVWKPSELTPVTALRILECIQERSEERRVGKEGRARWARRQSKRESNELLGTARASDSSQDVGMPMHVTQV